MPAREPGPGRLTIPLSAPAPVAWQPLVPHAGPWQVYRAAPGALTAAKIDGETWVGTTEGLRVLDAAGHEKPLAPWQEALRGRHVEAIAAGSEWIWLATWRGAPFNA